MFYPIRRYTLNGGIMPARNGVCFVANLKKQTDTKNSRIIEKSFSDISRTNECVYLREEEEREGRETQ